MGRSGWPKEASILCRWDSGESSVYRGALTCGDKAVSHLRLYLGEALSQAPPNAQGSPLRLLVLKENQGSPNHHGCQAGQTNDGLSQNHVLALRVSPYYAHR